MKKKPDLSSFDRQRIPPRQNPLILLFWWVYAWFSTRRGKLHIRKVNMKGLKPPFLVLGTHQAFMDFLVTPLALFPRRANYISELEGFEAFGEGLYRHAGCLGTRKFTNDLSLVKNIKRVVDRKDIIVIYPEARYANVGTSTKLPPSVGKLAKYLDVPVVTLKMRGNYLQSPIWNLAMRKQARLDAEMVQLFTQEELRHASVDEINTAIGESLAYDEYAYQVEENIEISYPGRAEGLELVLYQCPQCREELSIRSQGADIMCSGCSSHWRMDYFGRMEPINIENSNSLRFSHIPYWYEWQRENVIKTIEENNYHFSGKVCIESLPNGKNFIPLGNGHLTHTSDGFTLLLKEYGQTEESILSFPTLLNYSIHTEYNYRGKGQCVTLSTLDNTYFIYPLEEGFNATKLQFAAEYLYQKYKTKVLKD